MKKTLCIVLTLILTVCVFASCGKNGPSGNTSEKENNAAEKLSIVVTVFPEYDWIRNILGEKLDGTDVVMLQDNGADLHSYQPTVSDMMTISDCDIFVYVGGESDAWVDDVLAQADNKDMTSVNLMEILGDMAKEEETKEGMQSEEEEGEEEEGPEYDEHVWLSVKNAIILCDGLCDALCEKDAANADVYRENTAAYKEKLSALDADYADVLENAKVKTLVFADRFPFRYLVDDYGLDYYAAFSGCSAETEASFETIRTLVEKVDSLGLDCVFTLEGSEMGVAQTISKESATGEKKIYQLDSIQSVTAKDVEDGADYISIMSKNLDVLREALN